MIMGRKIVSMMKKTRTEKTILRMIILMNAQVMRTQMKTLILIHSRRRKENTVSIVTIWMKSKLLRSSMPKPLSLRILSLTNF